MNDNYVVASVNWQRKWTRSVVCSSQGDTLSRAVWPCDEAEDHLVPFFNNQRERYGVPVVVTGRTRDPWPDGLLRQLWRSGFAVELYEGTPLATMLHFEQKYRENAAFRTASLLAAVHLARKQQKSVGDARDFVLRWCMMQAKHRQDELSAELLSVYRPDWNEQDIEYGPWLDLRPSVYSELVCLSVEPRFSALPNSLREAC